MKTGARLGLAVRGDADGTFANCEAPSSTQQQSFFYSDMGGFDAVPRHTKRIGRSR
ncbi:hypothetical protein U1872_13535 [Sphingomonas sp. RB3P16]|uniref:hypothetical protein n=1 Tax=Parasphingomonas frigoris TaxID=3096163 RepID=UPI002FC63DD2